MLIGKKIRIESRSVVKYDKPQLKKEIGGCYRTKRLPKYGFLKTCKSANDEVAVILSSFESYIARSEK